VSAVFTRLRAAMLRHPAEPYFARLGALLAITDDARDPMPWLNLALERDSRSGRTRLLLARALRRKGALRQALAESRAAAQLEPDLAPTIGKLAASWTDDPTEIARAAPAASTGASVLTSAALWLGAKRADSRKACLNEAIVRDPSYVDARRVRARHLLNEIRDGRCTSDQCTRILQDDIEALRRLRPHSAEGVLLRSELLQAKGQSRAASDLLGRECKRLLRD